ARATGNPGVCLAVCGPGVLNASTALATSFTDSIPVLCISGQVPKQGLRSGYYHENEQLHVCKTLTKQSLRVSQPQALPPALDTLMEAIINERCGPGLLELPLDVLRSEFGEPSPLMSPPTSLISRAIENAMPALLDWLRNLKRPLLLAGGGVVSAGAEKQLAQMAERLGAPVLHTLMGKCAINSDHPLAA